MLANLLDLEAVTVNDVMTPRNHIHAFDLATKPTLIAQQLATSYHARLPAYEGQLDNIVGIVHLKHVVPLQRSGDLGPEELRSILRPAYFVPSGTSLLFQLQQFQADRERLGLVVDEYGELVGLVTIEDIIEEIIGDFTTGAGAGRTVARPMAVSSSTACGTAHPNRKLGTRFRSMVRKTLNARGRQLGEIPEAGGASRSPRRRWRSCRRRTVP
jgi:Mg2+/Co2+ transporter CorB